MFVVRLDKVRRFLICFTAYLRSRFLDAAPTVLPSDLVVHPRLQCCSLLGVLKHRRRHRYRPRASHLLNHPGIHDPHRLDSHSTCINLPWLLPQAPILPWRIRFRQTDTVNRICRHASATSTCASLYHPRQRPLRQRLGQSTAPHPPDSAVSCSSSGSYTCQRHRWHSLMHHNVLLQAIYSSPLSIPIDVYSALSCTRTPPTWTRSCIHSPA